MKNETILKKAIEKAVKNGYKYDFAGWFPYEPIIFSHDFAKAFWGEEEAKEPFMKIDVDPPFAKLKIKFREKTWIPNQEWQYHLQQMVLEKEPLKYLKKFL